MKRSIGLLNWTLAALLLVWAGPYQAEAKSYSSGGGRSYSSSRSSSSGSRGFSSGGSSRSFSSGSRSSSRSGSSERTRSYRSSSGKSYSSGSLWNDESRRSYQSSKSYSSGGGHSFRSSWSEDQGEPSRTSSDTLRSGASRPKSDFTFDAAAARARQEEASRRDFQRFRESQAARSREVSPPAGSGRADEIQPSRVPNASSGSYRPPVYVPSPDVLVTRPTRLRTVFTPYYTRPTVIYSDPYSSLFWWWLLDRSLDERAWWAYNHRYDMDPARYQALVANDQRLEARVAQLEAERTPRDPGYVPPGLDRDLMYSDQHLQRIYNNRPTLLGVIAFWLFAIPMALIVCSFFIWLIWFKRWQTAT